MQSIGNALIKSGYTLVAATHKRGNWAMLTWIMVRVKFSGIQLDASVENLYAASCLTAENSTIESTLKPSWPDPPQINLPWLWDQYGWYLMQWHWQYDNKTCTSSNFVEIRAHLLYESRRPRKVGNQVDLSLDWRHLKATMTIIFDIQASKW